MQIDALRAAGCERIFEEKVSGTKDDMKQLAELFDYVRQGDVAVVYKLDRLGRSARKLPNLTDT